MCWSIFLAIIRATRKYRPSSRRRNSTRRWIIPSRRKRSTSPDSQRRDDSEAPSWVSNHIARRNEATCSHMASAMKDPCVSPGACIADLLEWFVLQSFMLKESAPQLYFLSAVIMPFSMKGLTSMVNGRRDGGS